MARGEWCWKPRGSQISCPRHLLPPFQFRDIRAIVHREDNMADTSSPYKESGIVAGRHRKRKTHKIDVPKEKEVCALRRKSKKRKRYWDQS